MHALCPSTQQSVWATDGEYSPPFGVVFAALWNGAACSLLLDYGHAKMPLSFPIKLLHNTFNAVSRGPGVIDDIS